MTLCLNKTMRPPVFVVYIEHLARFFRAYVRKHTQTVTRNTEIFDFVVFLSLLGSEVFHELTVCGISKTALWLFLGARLCGITELCARSQMWYNPP